jgi:hypothetical protein
MNQTRLQRDRRYWTLVVKALQNQGVSAHLREVVWDRTDHCPYAVLRINGRGCYLSRWTSGGRMLTFSEHVAILRREAE